MLTPKRKPVIMRGPRGFKGDKGDPGPKGPAGVRGPVGEWMQDIQRTVIGSQGLILGA